MKRILLSISIMLVSQAAVYAMPAWGHWQTKHQPDGSSIQVRLMGDEFYHYWQDTDGNIVEADAQGYWRVVETQPSAASLAARRKASPMYISKKKKAIGTPNLAPRGLVILVNFSDCAFDEQNNLASMEELLNGENYTYDGSTGSVKQFFEDQSDGQYSPQFDVVGPVTLAHPVAYYGSNRGDGMDTLAGDMVVEACRLADSLYNVDFTRYDNDHDQLVDFVYFIYAGKGEADRGPAHTIWPHNWDLQSAAIDGICTYAPEYWVFDGLKVNNYACSCELNGNGKRAGIAVTVHEFTHVIGMPDLYDTDYGQNAKKNLTPGSWHVMDDGAYNNACKTPPNYTTYDKYFFGWHTPLVLGQEAQDLSLIAAGQEGYQSYQISNSNELMATNATDTVYYIENRQQTGWDSYLPGHGMLVWRVIFNDSLWVENMVNSIDNMLYYTQVSSANAETALVGGKVEPLPGKKNIRAWQGPQGKQLTNIREEEGVIHLHYSPELTTSIDEAESEESKTSMKILRDGQLVIVVNGVEYNVMGAKL